MQERISYIIILPYLYTFFFIDSNLLELFMLFVISIILVFILVIFKHSL